LLKVDIITLFPQIFFGPFSESIVARAIGNKKIEINAVDLREFTSDKRKTVDDKPYGGGPGMLMKPEPLFKAVEKLKGEDSYVILMSPQGEPFKQRTAEELSEKKHLIIICGHYEGVDERVRDSLIDAEISIGDYILTSGNLPAMVIVDAVTRLIPGVLGSEESSSSESFSEEGLLEYPQYTRPEEFMGMKVPEVLLSGNHGEIASWRKEESRKRTMQRRPDLSNN
jgi:tRNA (guanine37-N1)-methyltransferase